MSRPERMAPPDVFYDEKEAAKYTDNSRMITIQTVMAERCLELLNFPDDSPRFLLDIGCGSGLSGDVITEAGHEWVGLDISAAMLDIAVGREVCGDVMRVDMGQGFNFRPGVFDGAISVSALQWLCYSDKKDHKAAKRLRTFFTSLYRCLRRGARAALQVYAEDENQLELMTTIAMQCGFKGGLVVDFPNSTKAKKYYLCLIAGVDTEAPPLPPALGTDAAAAADVHAAADEVMYESRRAATGKKKRRERVPVKSRAWILAKKEARRRRGLETRSDSKYTGRRRSGKL